VLLAATPATLFAENFDAAAAPALPAGWIARGESPWATRSPTSRDASKAVVVRGPAYVSNNALTSPKITIPRGATDVRLTFTLDYAFSESALPGFGFDGMVLEVAVAAPGRRGHFRDVLVAGGAFAAGGYDGRLVSGAGRAAWVDSSAGPQTVAVDLPATVAGQTVRLRFREVTDRSRASAGAILDDFRITADLPRAGGPGGGNPGDGAIRGTPGADDIRLVDAPGGRVLVTVNGVAVRTFAANEPIVVRAGDGDDTVDASACAATRLTIFGDAGRDTIAGGAGDDVLVGGSGDDRLAGNAGRDLIVGGYGSDALSGGAGDDLLVSGFTAYDDDAGALDGIRAAWSRDDAAYESRLADVRGGDDGDTDAAHLTAQTVFGNGLSPDTLRGDAGRDVFYYDPTAPEGQRDLPVDRARGEARIFIAY
jgi:hypothetical protein